MKTWKHYGMITLSIFIVAVGVYFFKFPNNFCFGGVTGAAALVAKLCPLSAGDFTMAANLVLLVVAWLFVDRAFAISTAYASVLLSALLMLFEKIYPLSAPLSDEPTLDLLFAIALPAIGSALLFYMGASSGGTDVLAMVLKKYTNLKDIGIALFVSDLLMIVAACFVFDIKTALYSFVGLTVKSFLIDDIIQSITLCKSITIITTDPDAICHFITQDLNKSATVVEGWGAYTNAKKHVIFTTLTRRQADRLRVYIHEHSLDAFLSAASTNEVFGKGFSQV
ncbi:MAG: YitT family protein [Gemmiger sp.]|nr:YitT family protein [Gemmiger sp.]